MSDIYGRRSIILAPRAITAIVTVPSFLLLNAFPSAGTLYLATLALTALTAMSGAATLTAVPELLPPSVRAGGFAIAYAAGASLFGARPSWSSPGSSAPPAIPTRPPGT